MTPRKRRSAPAEVLEAPSAWAGWMPAADGRAVVVLRELLEGLDDLKAHGLALTGAPTPSDVDRLEGEIRELGESLQQIIYRLHAVATDERWAAYEAMR